MRNFSEVLEDWFEAKNSLEFDELTQEEIDQTSNWVDELKKEFQININKEVFSKVKLQLTK